MSRGTIYKIDWGASLVNTLEGGYWLDGAVSWSSPRPGYDTAVSGAGEEDAWSTGIDYYLSGMVRWVPTTDDTTPRGDPITGWDGTTGWRAFLEWAWKKNEFDFYPDRDLAAKISSVLVEPTPDFRPRLESADSTRRFRLVIRNSSTPYSGY